MSRQAFWIWIRVIKHQTINRFKKSNNPGCITPSESKGLDAPCRGLFESTIPAFTSDDWRKLRKPLIWITDKPIGI